MSRIKNLTKISDILHFDVLKRILKSSVLLIILTIIIVAFGFNEFYTNDHASNAICISCHSMKPFSDTLLNTPHEKLSCYTCHKTGIVELSSETYKYLTVNPIPSDIEKQKLLLKDQCLTCHQPAKLQSEVKIHKVHWNLVAETSTCTFCHTSHLLTPPKDACLGCHGYETTASSHEQFHIDANKAIARGEVTCSNCHSSDAKWMMPLNRPSIDAAVEGRNCFDCHSTPLKSVDIRDQDCLECHGRGH